MGGAISLLGAGGEVPPGQSCTRRGLAALELVEVSFEAVVLSAVQEVAADGTESAVASAVPSYLVFGRLRAYGGGGAGAPAHALDPPFLALAPVARAGGGAMPVCEEVSVFSSRTMRSVVYYRGELALELMPQPCRGGARRRYILRVDDSAAAAAAGDVALSKKLWKNTTRLITLVFRNYWQALSVHGVPHAPPGFAPPQPVPFTLAAAAGAGAGGHADADDGDGGGDAVDSALRMLLPPPNPAPPTPLAHAHASPTAGSGRGPSPASAGSGHLDGRPRDGAAPHGGGQQGGDRFHGRRHAVGCSVATVPPIVALLPPELQPSHKPADRQPARRSRHELAHAVQEPGQRAGTEQDPARSVHAREPGHFNRHV
jgi:hypothetical protein